MNTDSLKMLWRVSEWPKQARLASPSLTLHTLPTLPRCRLRSAKYLSEHTERAISRRALREMGRRFSQINTDWFSFFESKKSVLIRVQIPSASS